MIEKGGRVRPDLAWLIPAITHPASPHSDCVSMTTHDDLTLTTTAATFQLSSQFGAHPLCVEDQPLRERETYPDTPTLEEAGLLTTYRLRGGR